MIKKQTDLGCLEKNQLEDNSAFDDGEMVAFGLRELHQSDKLEALAKVVFRQMSNNFMTGDFYGKIMFLRKDDLSQDCLMDMAESLIISLADFEQRIPVSLEEYEQLSRQYILTRLETDQESLKSILQEFEQKNVQFEKLNNYQSQSTLVETLQRIIREKPTDKIFLNLIY